MQGKKSFRPFIAVVGIIVLFVLPVVIARFVFDKHLIPQHEQNYGTLLKQHQLLQKLPLKNSDENDFSISKLKGKWSLIYLYPGQCEQLCFQHLFYLRQIKLSLHDKASRVNRLFVTMSQSDLPRLKAILKHDYPGTYLAFMQDSQIKNLVPNKFNKNIAFQDGFLYVADPLGNIILGYQANANPEGILKDLNLLLSISQIG